MRSRILPIRLPGVLKSHMELVDILFPQNIGPLTYRVPLELRKAIRPGLMVEADVRKNLKRGIVMGPPEGNFVKNGKLKEIAGVLHDSPSLSPAMVKLVRWIAQYYVCTQGLALKGMLPPEFFEPVGTRGTPKVMEPQSPYTHTSPHESALEALRVFQGIAARDGYHGFLHHAPTLKAEAGFVIEAIRGMNNVIIIMPDKKSIAHFLPALQNAAGQRLVQYHSDLSRGRRSEAIERIASGLCDVVIGSLSAVFAPLPQVSLIAVLGEESTLYKAESTPRFNARDSAVMRAYFEGSSVLLSSICPSVESWHNAHSGKYTMLDTATGALRPKVRIIDAWKQPEAVSASMRSAITKALSHGQRTLLYVNRKGYSMIRCDDCGHIDRCPQCDIPMVFHKDERLLRCGYCGREGRLYDACPSCRGSSVTPTGMGLERIEDELRELAPVGVDAQRRNNLNIIMDDAAALGVGTKTLTHTAALGGSAQVAGVLNADALLHTPDFRSRERAFEDLIYTAELASPKGELIVQTRYHKLPIYNYIRRFDFRKFYEEELKERREAQYPPFARMAVLDIKSTKEPVIPMGETPGDMSEDIMVLGPVPVRSKPRKGSRSTMYRVLIKAPTRTALHAEIDRILSALDRKNVFVDVDPVGY